MRKRKPRPAFVLITVVILLAIVTMMLARLAIMSLSEARETNRQQRSVRTHWCVTSIKTLMLERGEQILSQQTGQSPPEASSRRTLEFDMAGTRWRVTLSDEETKLNLIKLAEERPLVDVREAANSLLFRGSTASLNRYITLDAEGKGLGLAPGSDSGFGIQLTPTGGENAFEAQDVFAQSELPRCSHGPAHLG